MTKEDKSLLLIDLCGRLPYFVQVNINGEIQTLNSWADDDGNYFNFLSDESDGNYGEGFTLDEVKPYLRPISSMTEEEKNKFQSLQKYFYGERYIGNNEWEKTGKVYYNTVESLDWLNAHHFDYRGLIEKGLALKAPEDMYKTE